MEPCMLAESIDSGIPEVLYTYVAACFVNTYEHVFGIFHCVLIPLSTPSAQLPESLNGPQNGSLARSGTDQTGTLWWKPVT